jgi:DNA-binding response OmpR family regulator
MPELSVAQLASEVVRLRALLSDTACAVPADWRLTKTEETIWRVLLAHDCASAALIAEAAEVPTLQSVRVHLMRLRKKLMPQRVEIETLNGRGWRLVGRDHWARVLAGGAVDNKEGVH